MEFEITALQESDGPEVHIVAYGVRQDCTKPDCPFYHTALNSTISIFLKRDAVRALGLAKGTKLVLGVKA